MGYEYDYLVVGAGLFGAVFAHEMTKRGKKCLVLEKRGHIAGNVYTEKVHGIEVHRYGAHIFHTSLPEVWDYVQQFAAFNNYVNAPIAFYHDEVYNLPFNMNTFSRMWGVKTPAGARTEIARQVKAAGIVEPRNLEEQAISLVGCDVYEKLIKGYTEKQWGRPCTELPAYIIRRLPVRYTYDNNYFRDPYQGIPIEGYTKMVSNILAGVEVKCGVDYLRTRDTWHGKYGQLLFTGPIDAYFGYSEGKLAYRSLRFETEYLPATDNYQGNAVINYTAREVPYTRVIEHKHFVAGTQPGTVVTHEYPVAWTEGAEPYYTINDAENMSLLEKYQARAQAEAGTIFGGRLGSYRYYDMDKTIAAALAAASRSDRA
jgi:UDP-galactopyranose mutase